MRAQGGAATNETRLRRRTAALAALVLLGSLWSACERIDRNMWENPAFRPQEEPVRLPPKDSIPTKGIEHVPSLGEAAGLASPVEPTERELLRGKELFSIFCVPCHGESGAGDGLVGKKFEPAPADLRAGSPIMNLTDGQLFVVVSGGLGAMPAFRADLSPDDRWRTVSYMRTLK